MSPPRSALVLALAGILLTVLGDLRDERGELFDLEAQGAAPSCCGASCGCARSRSPRPGSSRARSPGVVLGAVVTDLVGLTARATAAEPPLVLELDGLVVAAGVAAYALAAAALVLLATRRAFSAPRARPRGGARVSALVEVQDVFRVYPVARRAASPRCRG